MKRTVGAMLAGLFTMSGTATSAPAPEEVAADKQAAAEAVRCSADYVRRGTSGMSNTRIWIMCTQGAAELGKRDVVTVAKQVVKQEGFNVFEIEKDPGWFRRTEESSKLSPKMLELLERDE